MKFLLACLLSVIVIGGLSAEARASLGGDSASIDGDQAAIGGKQRTSIAKTNYTIEEISTGYGVVREYLNNASGKVFAIAWTGQSHPDLTPLLGSSFKAYKKALKQQPRQKGHRHHTVTTSANVMVEHRGHMRKVEGRAIDPSLVPQGVSTNDIR